MGVRNGKIVMVKPDRLNPVSWDQICVQGRFGYDAVKTKERLSRHLVRQGDALMPSTYEDALGAATSRLAGVIEASGPASVGFLVAPWATNEEAYLAQKLARILIGTESIDSTAGPIAAAVDGALTGAFGTHVLTSDLSQLATASTIVVIADDLESSHNVAALRVKDAVVSNNARLIVVSSRYGEVCDFIAPPPAGSIMPSPQRVHSADPTGVWLRPAAGAEVAAVAALGALLAQRTGADAGTVPAHPGVEDAGLERATAILHDAKDGQGTLAIVYAPNPASPPVAAEMTKAAANLAILCRGDQAAESLNVLPADSNTNGIRDMGAKPVLSSVEGPGASGLGIDAMLAGGVKALVVVGDNPMLLAHDKDRVEATLRGLDCLIVIDSLRTDTASLAHVVFADLTNLAKDGTHTSADRRIVRLSRAEAPIGDQRDCLQTLSALGAGLASRLGKTFEAPGDAASMMNEASLTVDGYALVASQGIQSGITRALPATTSRAEVQRVTPPALPAANGRLLLTTSRTLYTSREATAIHSPEADKLHREEFLELNPADAGALGIGQNRAVIVSNGSHELTLSAALTDAVAPGSAFLPLYFQGGLVNQLLQADGTLTTIVVRPA